MRKLKELKAWAGNKIHGTQFNIDIVGYCSLHCPSCSVGAIATRRDKTLMSIDTFRRILDKAQSETKVRKVQLYIYTDPLLHPECHKFVQELTDRGIPSTMSTMLQTTKADIAKVIEARPTEFRISFPGWEQMSYFQAGAMPKIFNVKIDIVCALPRYPETSWNLVYHSYKTNVHEFPKVKALAEKHNLKLIVLPAIWMSLEKMVEKTYNEADKKLISHLWETPEDAVSRMEKELDWCSLWKQVSLGVDGSVYLCQLVYEDRFKIGNFLSMPLSEIRRKVKSHSFCGDCMKCGGNRYQECYAPMESAKDPVGEANRKRHYQPSYELPK